jgi:type VI secretion system protein ImpJ
VVSTELQSSTSISSKKTCVFQHITLSSAFDSGAGFTMTSHSVYWGDGLFLRPHHFQRLELHSQESLRLTESWATPNHYGLVRFSYEQDALSNWRISLRECHLRLPDGSQVRYPEDCHIAAVSIPKTAFTNSESRVRVYVGISELRRGSANVGRTQTTPPARYVLHDEDVEDENRAGNPQALQFRKLNPQILIGSDAIKGFDAVPIMQLRLGSTAEAPPQIDTDYIPPLLAVDAWEPLTSFVRSVTNRLGALADQLARQMNDRGVAFGSGHREDLERILHLHAINSSLGGLGWLPLSRGVHPQTVYCEFCRAVGELAIFRSERKIAELPVYDHDNPGPCFRELGKLLEVESSEVPYERIPFSAQGLQMSVRLRPEWLAPAWAFYIGVEATLRTTRVNDLLTSERELGIKAGSSEEVDNIFKFAKRGVRFMPVSEPPRAFPRQNWHFFRVDRDEAWAGVEKTLNFGIRFNERMVVKQVPGENRMDVTDKESGGLATLAFSLFVIRASGNGES